MRAVPRAFVDVEGDEEGRERRERVALVQGRRDYSRTNVAADQRSPLRGLKAT